MTKHDLWPCTVSVITHGRALFTSKNVTIALYLRREKQTDLSYEYSVKTTPVQKVIAFILCMQSLAGRTSGNRALLRGQSISTIPNPIDVNLFKPRDKKEARIKCIASTKHEIDTLRSVKKTDKRKGLII
jgi:hypothetical protein